MLRACLIVALLAGLGALAVTHLVVGSKYKEVTEEKEKASQERDTAQQAASKAQGEARKAVESEKKIAAERDTFKADLDKAKADIMVQRKRSAALDEEVANLTVERNTARESLAAWNVLGVPVDQVRQMKIDLQKVREEKEAMLAENVIVARKLGMVQRKLDVFEGKEIKITLPPGLKGKVVAIDPKHDFVVLNFGSDQGAAEMGEMLVNRGGKLVAKIRLTKVHPDRSIANILPEWKQSDVVEGDAVMSAL